MERERSEVRGVDRGDCAGGGSDEARAITMRALSGRAVLAQKVRQDRTGEE